MSKQKLILIAGMPGSGKTYISRKISKILKIDNIISVDVLKICAKQFLNKKTDPYFFTTTHQASEVEGTDEYLAFKNYSNVYCKYLTDPINNQIFDNISIIEGAQISDTLIDYIDCKKFEVYAFFLCLKSKREFIKRFKKKEKTREGLWIKNLDKIFNLQERIIKDTKFFVINNKNKYVTLRKIIKEIKNESIFS